MAPMENTHYREQAPKGIATILALGTANPSNFIYQSDYTDFYFRVTKSEHMTKLKDKLNRICKKSQINKRHLHLSEDILRDNPKICEYGAPSLDARQSIMVKEVPKLGVEAALQAIKEWGQPISNITHLIFCTSSAISMPSADCQLLKLLGLNPSTKRFMIYQQGCFAGGTALRLAKDVAENNSDARVLIVCSEMTGMIFHGPSETHLDILLGQALFGDGAAAVIVGANPDTETEHGLYQLVSASQTIIPGTEDAIIGQLREMGLSGYLSSKNPEYVGKNVESCLVEAFSKFGISDWNSLFYIVHPGGPAILDKVEQNLSLDKEKLSLSRHVLSEYGNMESVSVFFIMDELRKKSIQEGKNNTGQGLEWGVLFGFGPGLTVETVVLRSMALVD